MNAKTTTRKLAHGRELRKRTAYQLKLSKRVAQALRDAAFLKKQITQHRAGADLAEATLLQGILAGDIHAAGIATRARLLNENLRLRQRITGMKMRTESIKQAILRGELELQSHPRHTRLDTQLRARILEIYGLDRELLLPKTIATVTSQPIPLLEAKDPNPKKPQKSQITEKNTKKSPQDAPESTNSPTPDP